MIIQCPACRFQRNVPEDSIKPGKKYKVTCPKCLKVFGFSLPDAEGEKEAPESMQQAVLPVLPKSEENPVLQADPAVLHHAAAQNIDDPLPPEAQIVCTDDKVEQQDVLSEEKKTAAPKGLISKWKSIRDNLRKYDEAQEESDGRPKPEGVPEGAPWENPEYYGFWGSFTRTVLGVMFRPKDFFRHIRCEMSLFRPVLFFVLLSVYQMLTYRLWSMKALREIMAGWADPQTLAMAETLMKSMNLPLMLLITPFFSMFQAVLLAGIYHLMFRIVQPGSADFSTTLRIVCYSAAPFILCIVPIAGSQLASVWFVAATFLGCKYALNIPWTRTLLAMLPLFLLELAFVSQLSVLMGA